MMSSNWRDIGIKNFKELLPPKINKLLDQRDSGPLLVEELPKNFRPKDVSSPTGDAKTEECRLWELVGLYLRESRRLYDALAVFFVLYNQILIGQDEENERYHKGMPLLWISECFLELGYRLHSKRYLMLTLAEDAITGKGVVDPESTGSYFRLVWHHGLSDKQFRRYASTFYQHFLEETEMGRYPEWLLQEVDSEWITEFPSIEEASKYYANQKYVSFLLSHLGDRSGKTLEYLASYVLSCVPGLNPSTRRRSRSTDYDIICSVKGIELDFRSEIGRYFVCECKDWKKPADFSTIAKFCRVLDSTKSHFGILFSTNGISGKGKGTDAEREQIKIFQDRGLAILVIDKNDLLQVADGANFTAILSNRYEIIRLDLK